MTMKNLKEYGISLDEEELEVFKEFKKYAKKAENQEKTKMNYTVKVNEVKARDEKKSNIKGYATVVFGDSFRIGNATLPKSRIPCPECGHTEAFFVIRQTRAADEPETRIYRCCKCNHSWREY